MSGVTPDLGREQLAALVCETLDRHCVQVVLSGGASVLQVLLGDSDARSTRRYAAGVQRASRWSRHRRVAAVKGRA